MNKEQKKRLAQTRISNEKLNARLTAKTVVEGGPVNRIRQGFREHADRQNPNPTVTTFDSKGRPKEPSDYHKWLARP